MINRMLGAPLGGTTRGGHQVFEPSRVSLITPPNFGGGTGIWLPSIVVVALGEPSSPVTCCAATGEPASVAASSNAATAATTPTSLGFRFMLCTPLKVGALSCFARFRAVVWTVRIDVRLGGASGSLVCPPPDSM